MFPYVQLNAGGWCVVGGGRKGGGGVLVGSFIVAIFTFCILKGSSIWFKSVYYRGFFVHIKLSQVTVFQL